MNTWLKDNSWNLIVTGVALVLAFATLGQRVEALEIKINEYPSQDYFELKFDTIETKIDDVEEVLDKHLVNGKNDE